MMEKEQKKVIFEIFHLQLQLWIALKVLLTLSHICGHVTHAMWDLKIPGESLVKAWSTIKGVKAILVKGYIPKK